LHFGGTRPPGAFPPAADFSKHWKRKCGALGERALFSSAIIRANSRSLEQFTILTP
jgi:hypothetical protein